MSIFKWLTLPLFLAVLFVAGVLWVIYLVSEFCIEAIALPIEWWRYKD